MKKSLILICSTILLLCISGVATATNIALHSTVTFHGSNLYTGARDQAPLSTLVDGVFLNRGHTWDDGTVSWLYRDQHAIYGDNGYIKFDLGGVFNIDSFIAQLDDNDAYILSYWDMTLSEWSTAWNIPNYDGGNWGMTTRPNPLNNTLAYNIGSIITTNALKLEGNIHDGDNNFSASEIQAFGSAAQIPEPAALALMGLGLAGIGYRRRKTA